MDFHTLDNLIKQLPDYFLAENSEGINSAISVYLIGEINKAWTIRIKNKTCHIEEGSDPKASLSLTASPENIADIFSGKLDPTRAFMHGKLKFSGNINLAMRFSKLFDIQSLRQKSELF